MKSNDVIDALLALGQDVGIPAFGIYLLVLILLLAGSAFPLVALVIRLGTGREEPETEGPEPRDDR